MKNFPIIEINNGYKINYIEKGEGTPLVFIHGWLGSSWVFEAQIEYFSKNYRAIAIDHLGHGKSDKPESESYKLEDLVKFLDEALSKIIDNEKIILLGHSMGGMIAQIYASTPILSKRLDGLVLMSTTPKYHNQIVDQSKGAILSGQINLLDDNIVRTIIVNLMFDRTYQKAKPDFIKEFIIKTLEMKENVAFGTFKSVINFDNTEKIKDITVPTLILTSDKDAMISPKDSELMQQKIPNSKLIILSPKIGHYIQYEAREEYHKAIEEFIKTI
ncbi:MAG: alpha/beta hydrolase [Promethearchaeota archaeon]|nr:MAG: alpha/beta hydrolase [Candidatus Lokiarchaeota archaeon]